MSLKHPILKLFMPLALLALLVTACGSPATTATGSGTPAATTTAAPTAPASAPTTAPTTASNGPVGVPALPLSTRSEPIQGPAPATFLTDAQGMTLYVYIDDTAETSACTGACAQQWPPLLIHGSCTPTSTAHLPGVLSVVHNANGLQVEYQGYPLYTSVHDTKPGQIYNFGDNSGWGVAAIDLLTQVNPNGPPLVTPTPGAWCE